MSLYTSIVILALLAVIASLAWGIVSMAHGGQYDHAHSEQLMIARVSLQAVAFVLLILALFFPLS